MISVYDLCLQGGGERDKEWKKLWKMWKVLKDSTNESKVNVLTIDNNWTGHMLVVVISVDEWER